MARNSATRWRLSKDSTPKRKRRSIRIACRSSAVRCGRRQVGHGKPFQPWDPARWDGTAPQEQYDFDEEALRPYLSVKKACSRGMFTIAERRSDVTITGSARCFASPAQTARRADAPDGVEVWHPSVKFYEVHDVDGAHRGSFFADWHPRDAKRGGGWIELSQDGRPPDGDKGPSSAPGPICGISRVRGDAPALLTPYEVRHLPRVPAI